jgi:hypothetical protein
VTDTPVIGPSIGEMPWWRIILSRLYYWGVRQRRRLPYLVWYGDELDVVVTFSEDKLRPVEIRPGDDPRDAFHQLFGGAFFEIEQTLDNMGIRFDKGVGLDGRDWEWDWSLKGPISVRFKARATKPELRMERPKPKLVVNNKG